MKKSAIFGAAMTLAIGTPLPAMADTALTLGLSGWTGFAPLTLAKEAGIFEKPTLSASLRSLTRSGIHASLYRKSKAV